VKDLALESSDASLQVEMAAKGCVSGTLREWPMLARALKELGHDLPPSTPAATLRDLCRAERLKGDLLT